MRVHFMKKSQNNMNLKESEVDHAENSFDALQRELKTNRSTIKKAPIP